MQPQLIHIKCTVRWQLSSSGALYKWLINRYSRSWKSIRVVTLFYRFDGTSEISVILSSATPTRYGIFGTLVTCVFPLWHLDNYHLLACCHNLTCIEHLLIIATFLPATSPHMERSTLNTYMIIDENTISFDLKCLNRLFFCG